jgi:polyketide cyclase/dehydrase/lipid transport protein
MAPIVESIEVGRGPDEVFAYVGDLSRHGEWQAHIVEVHVDTDGPTGVGSRATEARRVPGGLRRLTYEITEWDPPRKASFRGTNGPVRAVGTMSVDPVGSGSRSRITLRLDFEGRGLGKLLLPLVRRDARKQVPQDQARLKQRLESGA